MFIHGQEPLLLPSRLPAVGILDMPNHIDSNVLWIWPHLVSDFWTGVGSGDRMPDRGYRVTYLLISVTYVDGVKKPVKGTRFDIGVW